MRLSKRGEYGLRAMIFIATALHNHQAENGLVQIKDISEKENIPAKYLEQILLTLKNAGLLHSKMGVGGGYYLGKPASEINLGQIFRVLDGPVAPIRCVSQMAYEPCGCPDEAHLRPAPDHAGCAQCHRQHSRPHQPGRCGQTSRDRQRK